VVAKLVIEMVTKIGWWQSWRMVTKAVEKVVIEMMVKVVAKVVIEMVTKVVLITLIILTTLTILILRANLVIIIQRAHANQDGVVRC